MNNDTKQIEDFIIGVLIVLVGIVIFPALIIFLLKKNKNVVLFVKKPLYRYIIGLVLTLPIIVLNLLNLKLNNTNLVYFVISFWILILGLALIIIPYINLKESNITTKYLKKHLNPKPPKNENLSNGAFIGESMVKNNPIFLTNDKRVMHTVVVGSTGSGKTTLLDTLYRYDCKNKTPIIIIDPKGNDETISKFKNAALKLGLKEEQFKVFSLAKPKESYSYNPLKFGTPIQIKDRLMDALEWSEPFYKNISDMFLINLIEIYYYMNKEITINEIVKALTNKDTILDLSDELQKMNLEKELKESLKLNISKLKTTSIEQLIGLKSQLNALNPIELNGLLSPNLENSKTINMIDVLNNSDIVYFSLNTLNYGVTAPIIGKLILQDLKSLTSQIHAKAVTVKNSYLSIFIDEFGSFAFNGFIDWQKMCRDVGFAVHLFFQSIADLKKVSPEFKDQVLSNSINKIVLRTDDPEECEFWASVAGTKDDIEQSYQVETSNVVFTTKTGMGNQRNTKSMIVEHDCFKQLSIGQAVFIQKSPHKVDLINLYRSN